MPSNDDVNPAPVHRLVGRTFPSVYLFFYLALFYLIFGLIHITNGDDISHLPVLFVIGQFFVLAHAWLPQCCPPNAPDHRAINTKRN